MRVLDTATTTTTTIIIVLSLLTVSRLIFGLAKSIYRFLKRAPKIIKSRKCCKWRRERLLLPLVASQMSIHLRTRRRRRSAERRAQQTFFFFWRNQINIFSSSKSLLLGSWQKKTEEQGRKKRRKESVAAKDWGLKFNYEDDRRQWRIINIDADLPLLLVHYQHHKTKPFPGKPQDQARKLSWIQNRWICRHTYWLFTAAASVR